MTVNCAAIPENLLESELFGHEKGAFTGAIAMKKGRFESAQGGSIFLDEIGDLPLTLQPKILRVLQEREFERVGGDRTIKVDTRIIAATSRDLEGLLAAGQFREDLYYRLNVVPIFIPPPRDRREDIPELVDYFASRFGKESGKVVRFTDEAVTALAGYSWPGNVRELENVVERTMVMTGKELIGESDLKLIPIPGTSKTGVTSHLAQRLPGTIREVETLSLKDALSRTGWNQAAAARLLGITPRQISYKIKMYRLTPDRDKA